MYIFNLQAGLMPQGAAHSELKCLEDYYESFKFTYAEILRYEDYNSELTYFTSSFIDDMEDSYFDNKDEFTNLILGNLREIKLSALTLKPLQLLILIFIVLKMYLPVRYLSFPVRAPNG